jgi:hypothetical protein
LELYAALKRRFSTVFHAVVTQPLKPTVTVRRSIAALKRCATQNQESLHRAKPSIESVVEVHLPQALRCGLK